MSVNLLPGSDIFWIAGGAPCGAVLFKLSLNLVPAWLEWQFQHAVWTDFVGRDMIMPLFLFIVGVAMPLLDRRTSEMRR